MINCSKCTRICEGTLWLKTQSFLCETCYKELNQIINNVTNLFLNRIPKSPRYNEDFNCQCRQCVSLRKNIGVRNRKWIFLFYDKSTIPNDKDQ